MGNFYKKIRVYKGGPKLKTPAELGEIYEILTEDLYSARLNPGDIAIDCGANVGRHTVGMAQRVGPGGKVHSFESSTAVLPMLKVHQAGP